MAGIGSQTEAQTPQLGEGHLWASSLWVELKGVRVREQKEPAHAPMGKYTSPAGLWAAEGACRPEPPNTSVEIQLTYFMLQQRTGDSSLLQPP